MGALLAYLGPFFKLMPLDMPLCQLLIKWVNYAVQNKHVMFGIIAKIAKICIAMKKITIKG